MKLSRHQGLGSSRTNTAPPPLRGEATIEIFVARELSDGSVRFGYAVLLGNKVVAEPTKSFKTRRALRKHADDLVDDLFTMFGAVSYRAQTNETPRLVVVDGGLAEGDTTPQMIEVGHLRLAA